MAGAGCSPYPPYGLPGLGSWHFGRVAGTEGLGYRITRAQRFLQTDQIFAVLIVVIGVSIDLAFG